MTTAVLTIAALAGCGADGEDRAGTVGQPTGAGTVGQSTGAAPAQPGAGSYSADQVKAALLTVADLPTGWSAEPDDGSAPEDASENYAECPEFAAVVKKAAGVEQLDADFKSPAGTSLDETIMTLNESGARDLVAGYAKGVAACPKLTTKTDGGTTFDMYMTALSFPKLADETVAHRVTAEVSGTTVNLDMVLVRRGGVVITLVQTATGVIDTAVTEDVARRALTKAEKALS
ncbi:hypothetical protein [Actinoplanes utahensis]|uniref:PknH-like extracellular domain-containing protein n=1 Tax=Actinoplanes utahensis TaxID=1869 RepID=A0A0A6UJ36_ACTUT|nr:hypothetical protein [Actinoplanes utahensis]KHD76125.1 hypothetical protein MB27_18450 [Actinoplanes utahensis]GIF28629.1 hypothetical protein Aut01nite_16150 [Actinoplanes utahensis]